MGRIELRKYDRRGGAFSVITFQQVLFETRWSMTVRVNVARGGAPHMKGVGMLVGNFELNP